MKKTMFSLLMLAAMFMIASCGSNSNSGEAAEEKEVTFTDPAISYKSGFDLTSYFSAESLTKPTVREIDLLYYLTTNVKLKLLKKLDNNCEGVVFFNVKFCDDNGSTIDEGVEIRNIRELENLSEGSIITLDVTSKDSDLEIIQKEKLDKVAKIEVSIEANLEFYETSEGNE